MPFFFDTRTGQRASGIAALVLVVIALTMTAAGAHFLLNLNVRIFHVEHHEKGLKVFARMPMPYLVADRIGRVGEDGLPAPAPFTTNKEEEGKLVHYVDPAAVKEKPGGLGAFALEGLNLSTNGARLEGKVDAVRLHRVGTQPDFATLVEARKAISSSPVIAETAPLYVGDTVVDLALFFPTDGPVYSYSFSSTLNPELPGQEKTANLILDYHPGGTEVFRQRGLLDQPVTISRSALAAVWTFIKEGIRHILEGVDHVLFVICLVLGATSLKSLLWRVTGFTIGHSVTLSAGFFGFVPSGAWFVPAVETGIALSIVYAAVIAVAPRSKPEGGERTMFLVTCAIGLLHGLGFSFVLHEILQVTSPDIWQSLLAFNVGVEIGQIFIVALAWPVFRLVQRASMQAWRVTSWGIAGACAAIALYWTGERALSVVATI
ncbi:MAG: HupE/UreJ family protein [Hyphomicrobiales bacterium]